MRGTCALHLGGSPNQQVEVLAGQLGGVIAGLA
jgi:hypothetical protein